MICCVCECVLSHHIRTNASSVHGGAWTQKATQDTVWISIWISVSDAEHRGDLFYSPQSRNSLSLGIIKSAP